MNDPRWFDDNHDGALAASEEEQRLTRRCDCAPWAAHSLVTEEGPLWSACRRGSRARVGGCNFQGPTRSNNSGFYVGLQVARYDIVFFYFRAYVKQILLLLLHGGSTNGIFYFLLFTG